MLYSTKDERQSSLNDDSSSLLLFNYDENIILHILGFVGRHQYRFTATVNRRFNRLYNDLYEYNSRKSYFNVSTIKHANICCSEASLKQQPILCKIASSHGDLPMLQHLRIGLNCSWDQRTCNTATENGHLHILQWCRNCTIHINCCPWDKWSCIKAIRNGHLHILKWAKQCDTVSQLRHPQESSNGNSCTKNIIRNHELQWAYENIYSWENWICVYATEYGQLDILQWWWDQRLNCDPNHFKWNQKLICEIASRNGHVQILHWLNTL